MPISENWEQIGVNSAGDPIYKRRYGARYYEDLSTTGAAAELAAELGIDLSTITGTGKNGKITKADVEAAAND
jgi:e3 binding domain